MIEDCNEIHPHGEKGNKAVTYAKIKNGGFGPSAS